MIDIKLLRENPKGVKKGVEKKQYDTELVDRAIKLDEKKREINQKIEQLHAQRNKINQSDKKASNEAKKIKEELKDLEPQAQKIGEDFIEIVSQIPNLPSDESPIGKGEADNVEVKKWGEPKKFDFEPKDHLVLGKKLGILNFETGAKVTGSQFYFLYGDGVLLEMALVNYALEKLSKKGYIPVITPDLAKQRYYLGTGYLPKGEEAQTYEIKDTDLGLIATAEVTLAGSYADEVIPQQNLPLKYIGYSHCFRQEAGAYGKYSKGLYRVHQFAKTEMFIFCEPKDSEKYHQEILSLEEEICQDLQLPYRVIEMCTGDLGAMAARKFDVEVWMSGRGDYGEVTSTSNCTDYQARNLNIKYKSPTGNEYVHMLNGTAISLSRFPLAIMENYQQKDGSIKLPKVLQKWMGKEVIK